MANAGSMSQSSTQNPAFAILREAKRRTTAITARTHVLKTAPAINNCALPLRLTPEGGESIASDIFEDSLYCDREIRGTGSYFQSSSDPAVMHSRDCGRQCLLMQHPIPSCDRQMCMADIW